MSQCVCVCVCECLCEFVCVSHRCWRALSAAGTAGPPGCGSAAAASPVCRSAPPAAGASAHGSRCAEPRSERSGEPHTARDQTSEPGSQTAATAA